MTRPPVLDNHHLHNFSEERAILWPCRPDNPASIVAALGAADLLVEAGHRDVNVRWVALDDSRYPDYRPEITVDMGFPAMLHLARALEDVACPDISVLPAGTKQTLAGAVRIYQEQLGLGTEADAWVLLKRALRAAGYVREARLIGGSIAPVPARDEFRSVSLVRSPLTRGAKSDIRAATEGWRPARRPLTAEAAARHLWANAWNYTLRSGDWGLDGSFWGEQRQVANPKFGNVVLARLLTQGIMAMDGSWQPVNFSTFAWQRHPPRLGWPIWTWWMPVEMLPWWPSWALDPFGEDDPAPIGGSPSPGFADTYPVAEWYVAEAIPLNKFLSVYRHGSATSPNLVRTTMWEGTPYLRTRPASTKLEPPCWGA